MEAGAAPCVVRPSPGDLERPDGLGEAAERGRWRWCHAIAADLVTMPRALMGRFNEAVCEAASMDKVELRNQDNTG